MRHAWAFAALLSGSALLAINAAGAAAAEFGTVFSAPDAAGNVYPQGKLTVGGRGVVFGTLEGKQSGCNGSTLGSVFELTPAPAGQTAAIETTLYAFGSSPTDGDCPIGGVTQGPDGMLYGTTEFENGFNGEGTIYALRPPAAGQTSWSERILYRFGLDGSPEFDPGGFLALDAAGALYGHVVRLGGRTNSVDLFRYMPPRAGQASSYTVLYNCAGESSIPVRGPIIDASGAVYGTCAADGAHGAGTVFKLTPPPAGQTQWSAQTLYSFGGSPDVSGPSSTLQVGTDGVLYGTGGGGAFGLGAVYKLTPPSGPAGAWSDTVLYSFTGGADGCNPAYAVAVDPSGVLYGSTFNCGPDGYGTVFQLVPAAGGQAGWTFSLLHGFGDMRHGGGQPSSDILELSNGVLFGTTYSGGKSGGGTVYGVKP